MPSPRTNDPLHSDIPEEPAPMPTSDADAYARGREDERAALLKYLQEEPVVSNTHTLMRRIKDGHHVR